MPAPNFAGVKVVVGRACPYHARPKGLVLKCCAEEAQYAAPFSLFRVDCGIADEPL